MFNLFKRARLEQATTETSQILKEISKRCDPCQGIQRGPDRFRATIGAENVRFNERIVLYIMALHEDPVLHTVDDETHFSAAHFFPDVSTATVRRTILQCWAIIYTGLPNRILPDRESQFGDLFIHMARVANVQGECTGIEAHSSLGLGELYHESLRASYRKTVANHPNTERGLALSLAVEAMNDTLRPEGVVSSALVFGEHPQVRTASECFVPSANLRERVKVATLARKDMGKQMAALRVGRTLRHAVPPSSDRTYESEDQVLV